MIYINIKTYNKYNNTIIFIIYQTNIILFFLYFINGRYRIYIKLYKFRIE